MALILNPAIHEAVALDSLPRLAQYDDGSRHVLYLVGDIVHSVEAKDWAGALPTDPTPTESAAAIQARETERGNKNAAAALRRTRILALAADAVGEPIDRLSPRQLGAILALLHPEMVDDALEVRSLAEWAGQ